MSPSGAFSRCLNGPGLAPDAGELTVPAREDSVPLLDVLFMFNSRDAVATESAATISVALRSNGKRTFADSRDLFGGQISAQDVADANKFFWACAILHGPGGLVVLSESSVRPAEWEDHRVFAVLLPGSAGPEALPDFLQFVNVIDLRQQLSNAGLTEEGLTMLLAAVDGATPADRLRAARALREARDLLRAAGVPPPTPYQVRLPIMSKLAPRDPRDYPEATSPMVPPLVPRVFISYRREDSEGHTGRLFDALASRFGDEHVFMDIDTIPLGIDFARVISEAVASCDVLVAVIGRSWLTIADSSGRRRLDNPEDFVRLEIKAALERDVRVIPAVVQNAQMPASDQLPEDLAGLARRNGIFLRGDSWRHGVERVIRAVEEVGREKAERERLE